MLSEAERREIAMILRSKRWSKDSWEYQTISRLLASNEQMYLAMLDKGLIPATMLPAPPVKPGGTRAG